MLGDARAQRARDRRERSRFVRTVARPYRRRIVLVLPVIVFSTAANLAPPYLAGLVVNNVVSTGSTSELNAIVVALVAALALAWVGGMAQDFLVAWIGESMLRDVRLRAYRHAQTLSMAFYDRTSAGTIMSRLTNDVEALNQLVSTGLGALVGGAVLTVASFAAMLLIDWELALVGAFVIPVVVAGTIVYSRIAAARYRLAAATVGELTAELQETLAGGRVMRIFAQEERHSSRFADVNDRNLEARTRAVLPGRIYLPAGFLLSALGIGAILAYGGNQVIAGATALGTLVSFVAYMRTAIAPLPTLANVYTLWIEGAAGLDNIVGLLAERPETIEADNAEPLPPITREIRFERVSFAYQHDRTVLHEIDLAVPAGTQVAVVGRSGSGKSTLVKLLMRFYDPDSGRITVDGHDLRGVTLPSLRRQLGIVTQEPYLFAGTVRDNIAFGRPDASDREVRAAAEAVAALDVLEALPGGLDTEVGDRGDRLSSGQRQLVALARAMLVDPRVVVLDEATSSLDAATEERIGRGMPALMAGRTSFVVAHRLSTARNADLIVVMDAGRIVESGSHDELIAADGAYAGMDAEWDPDAGGQTSQ